MGLNVTMYVNHLAWNLTCNKWWMLLSLLILLQILIIYLITVIVITIFCNIHSACYQHLTQLFAFNSHPINKYYLGPGGRGSAVER